MKYTYVPYILFKSSMIVIPRIWTTEVIDCLSKREEGKGRESYGRKGREVKGNKGKEGKGKRNKGNGKEIKGMELK